MEKVSKLPERFWDDDSWIEAHYGELQKEYSGQWVAVADKRVVASGKNLAKVEEEAKMRTGLKHIPVSFVESGSVVY